MRRLPSIMWAGCISSVEGSKMQNVRVSGKEGILPLDCNTDVLPKWPVCQTALQVSELRL